MKYHDIQVGDYFCGVNERDVECVQTETQVICLKDMKSRYFEQTCEVERLEFHTMPGPSPLRFDSLKPGERFTHEKHPQQTFMRTSTRSVDVDSGLEHHFVPHTEVRRVSIAGKVTFPGGVAEIKRWSIEQEDILTPSFPVTVGKMWVPGQDATSCHEGDQSLSVRLRRRARDVRQDASDVQFVKIEPGELHQWASQVVMLENAVTHKLYSRHMIEARLSRITKALNDASLAVLIPHNYTSHEVLRMIEKLKECLADGPTASVGPCDREREAPAQGDSTFPSI